MRALFALCLVVYLACLGCGRDASNGKNSPARPNAQTAGVKLPAKESFTVTFPKTPPWGTVLDGPLRGLDGTYAIAVAHAERGIQLSVMVLPPTDDAPTLQAMIPQWEKGFLKKAGHKKRSELTTVSGHDAYSVTAAVDAGDGVSFDVTGILVIAHGRNYTLGITAPSEIDSSTREISEFLQSFRIVEPGTK